jgi:uncharacterized Zn finger protein
MEEINLLGESIPCQKCFSEEQIIEPRDAGGHHKVLCKKCGLVKLMYSDNGNEIEVKTRL